MTEMPIPEDIREKAFTAAGAWFYDHYLRDDLAADIGRLLLAERDRCAKIADREAITAGAINSRDVDVVMQTAAQEDTASRIATAIRNQA